MRQHPEPVTDIQGRKKSRETGCQIEIGKAIVEELGQPDLSGCKTPGIARYFLRGTKVEMFRRGLRQHFLSLGLVTVLIVTNHS